MNKPQYQRLKLYSVAFTLMGDWTCLQFVKKNPQSSLKKSNGSQRGLFKGEYRSKKFNLITNFSTSHTNVKINFNL